MHFNPRFQSPPLKLMELDILLPPSMITLDQKLSFLNDLEEKQQLRITKAKADKAAYDSLHTAERDMIRR